MDRQDSSKAQAGHKVSDKSLNVYRAKCHLSHIRHLHLHLEPPPGTAIFKGPPTAEIVRQCLETLPRLVSISLYNLTGICTGCHSHKAKKLLISPHAAFRSISISSVPPCCTRLISKSVLELCPALTHLRVDHRKRQLLTVDFSMEVLKKVKVLQLDVGGKDIEDIQDVLIDIRESCSSLEGLTLANMWH